MNTRRWIVLCLFLILASGALLPAGTFIQPVQGASRRDWHPDSFWHPHWGASGTHKGIDIFARRGAPVAAAQAGLVLYAGTIERGGNVVLAITARGWLHYYAHLDAIRTHAGDLVQAGTPLGTVGASGNAAGKPPHLHYVVLTLVPRPWQIRWVPEGWKRMFYSDPGAML